MEPPVSIVTPVYNEAGYLGECIESVLNQTYSNWDYTIIDNCSTDGTLEIAQRYAAKDRRVRVHHNSRLLGAIQNHNVALRQISPSSKYCKVVFGDDWLFPECLEKMVALAEDCPSVGIVGAYALEGERVAWSGLEYPSSVVNGVEICRRHLLDGLHVFGSANAVLYRADLVKARDPFYNETNIHADTEICFDLLRTCDFGFIHQVLTYTRMRSASLRTGTDDLETWYSCMLQVLVKHAPAYLTSEERDVLLARHVAAYYRFLGKSLMLGRDKEFWDCHKKELSKAGIVFSRTRVAKGVLDAVWIAAINPGDTARRLLQSKRKFPLLGRIHDRVRKPDALAATESQNASGTM
jgi:glycosyltransferase involved in cell wall biosynthesis